jgi:hypothetical protein
MAETNTADASVQSVRDAWIEWEIELRKRWIGVPEVYQQFTKIHWDHTRGLFQKSWDDADGSGNNFKARIARRVRDFKKAHSDHDNAKERKKRSQEVANRLNNSEEYDYEDVPGLEEYIRATRKSLRCCKALVREIREMVALQKTWPGNFQAKGTILELGRREKDLSTEISQKDALVDKAGDQIEEINSFRAFRDQRLLGRNWVGIHRVSMNERGFALANC